jgi:hypothetical protein
VPVLSFRRALSSLSYIPVPVMPAGAMAGQAWSERYIPTPAKPSLTALS